MRYDVVLTGGKLLVEVTAQDDTGAASICVVWVVAPETDYINALDGDRIIDVIGMTFLSTEDIVSRRQMLKIFNFCTGLYPIAPQ